PARPPIPKIRVCLAVLMIRWYIVLAPPDRRLRLGVAVPPPKAKARNCQQRACAATVQRNAEGFGRKDKRHDMAARRNPDGPKGDVRFVDSRRCAIDVRFPAGIVSITEK